MVSISGGACPPIADVDEFLATPHHKLSWKISISLMHSIDNGFFKRPLS
jgi:hypothetical protein